MRRQLLQVVLQRRAPPLHKVGAGALALDRVLLRPRGDEVAAVRRLQQVSQRLQRASSSTQEGLWGMTPLRAKRCVAWALHMSQTTFAHPALLRPVHIRKVNLQVAFALEGPFCEREQHSAVQRPPQSP